MKRLSERKKSAYLGVIGIAITLMFLFPLYWMLTTALRQPGETFSNPTFFPRSISLEAFKMESYNGTGILEYMINSIIISTGATVLGIVLAVPASYGLARFKSKFVGIMLFVFLVAQMLPSSLILTPLFSH